MLRPLVMLVLVALLGGCATVAPTETQMTIEPGQYAAAFAAARQVLRDERWTIERADPRAGIITTRTTYTASITGPADKQLASTLTDADDVLNRQQRLIRITFEPEGPPAEPLADMGVHPGPLVMRVRAVRLRVQDPGWRVPTTSIRAASRTIDPQLQARGMIPDYAVPLNVDEALSAQLNGLIAAKLRAPATAPAEPATDSAGQQPAEKP